MYHINADNGVKLAVQDWNPCGKHVLLLVHGWPLSQKMFEYQYDVLPKRDIRCISYDLRGYGDSDKPFAGYDYDRMADDLYRVIQSINCRSLTLLGFSMGGAIVTRYMARHNGNKVNKLVLCGAACPQFVESPDFPYGMTRSAVNDLIKQCYNDRPQMIEDFGKLCFAQPISTPFSHWFSAVCWKAAGHATIHSLETLRDEKLFHDLKRIKVPTMIMHGKKDKVCPYPFAVEMNKLIPHSFIVPFENSSHCLFYDEKEKFNNTLTDFVTGVK